MGSCCKAWGRRGWSATCTAAFDGVQSLRSHLFPHRDIAKNALLRWRVFLYWTSLGVFDALVFFFGTYLMFENTTVTSKGQVSAGWGPVGHVGANPEPRGTAGPRVSGGTARAPGAVATARRVTVKDAAREDVLAPQWPQAHDLNPPLALPSGSVRLWLADMGINFIFNAV